ncbi:MAG: amphi-Trp domain-containing protein [Clostridiales bacterium]|jgi:amphi-Trp domain-containing protein|nr:amphi-Trp domain-containing protein [Eubacteriales bacterium]MDH7565646.1 amphi-Trp domain-containing protein [Clostridiales bacterium]
MKYQNESQGTKADLKQYLQSVLKDIFGNCLVVEGQNVEIPDEAGLDYKVKYSVDEDGGSLAIKISWENNLTEEAAE